MLTNRDASHCAKVPLPRVFMAVTCCWCCAYFCWRMPAQAAEADDVRQAAVAFMNSSSQGDVNTCRQRATGNAQEMLLVDATCAQSAASVKLRTTAVAKYGDPGNMLGTKPVDYTVPLSHAQIAVNGDSATLSLSSTASPMRLTKIGQQWRVAVSSLIGDIPIEERIDRARRRESAYKTVTQGIEQGLYATADDAKTALDDLLENGQAATRPSATQPAKMATGAETAVKIVASRPTTRPTTMDLRVPMGK